MLVVCWVREVVCDCAQNYQTRLLLTTTPYL